MTSVTIDPSRKAIIGFSLTPSQTLIPAKAEALQQDIVSLLSSLTYHPPQVERISLDLRYLVTTDNSLAGKRFDIALLVSVTFDADKPPQVAASLTERFSEEFYNLLALHLTPYEFRIDLLPKEQVDHYLQPFAVADIVEVTRRIARHKPFELTHFKGNSPMTKIIDMLLRERGQYYLGILLEPHLLTQDEIDKMEVFGYKSTLLPTTLARELLEGIPGLQEQAEAMFPSFRAKVRLVGDGEVSQYLINLVGSEISGQRDFFQIRITSALSQEIAALRTLEFTESVKQVVKLPIPDILLGLVYLFRPDEAATAFRLPTERIFATREKLYRTYHAPVTNLPSEGVLIGTGVHPSHIGSIPIYIRPTDRKRHMYIVGKTGTGKSMLMLNMLRQDLRDKGVCLIDPHGELLDSVYPFIPEERRDDVHLLDPSDSQWLCGFNFLETTPLTTEAEKDHIVQELISTLLRTVDYNVEMYGPMAQQWTRYACMTLMDLPEGGTLLDVNRLFSDDDFRNDVLKRVTNPVLTWWWKKEYGGMSGTYKGDMLGYFTSKFSPLVSGPQLRNVVGQLKSGFNLQDITDSGKILLINLARGKIGQINSGFLGSMILSRLLWTIMRRAWDPAESRREFYLYVDEFQNFITESFEPMLSETRKYGLNLIVAHQHLEQLRAMGRLGNKIERAVFGNVGTMACFRVGTDAKTLQEEFGPPVEAETLRNLENRYGVMKLLVNEVPTMAFTMRTVDWVPASPAEIQRGERIHNAARRRNRPIAEVEEEVRGRFEKK